MVSSTREQFKKYVKPEWDDFCKIVLEGFQLQQASDVNTFVTELMYTMYDVHTSDSEKYIHIFEFLAYKSNFVGNFATTIPEIVAKTFNKSTVTLHFSKGLFKSFRKLPREKIIKFIDTKIKQFDEHHKQIIKTNKKSDRIDKKRDAKAYAKTITQLGISHLKDMQLMKTENTKLQCAITSLESSLSDKNRIIQLLEQTLLEIRKKK
jgi:hypothetical protein